MIDRQINPFRQDVVGDNSIAITANTEALFVINGAARNVSQGPEYMTNRWSTSSSTMTASTEHDGPTYVGDLGFVWTPSASAEGLAMIRVYINTSGTQTFATDPEIRNYVVSYKGVSAINRNVVATWYWGDEAGYDAKNDGIYFTIEFEHDGTVSSPSAVIYNTQ